MTVSVTVEVGEGVSQIKEPVKRRGSAGRLPASRYLRHAGHRRQINNLCVSESLINPPPFLDTGNFSLMIMTVIKRD